MINPSLQIFSEHLPEQADSEKPVLSNTYVEHKSVKPFTPESILKEVVNFTGGWPKCVAGNLVVKNREGEIEVLNNENSLFAWLHLFFQVDWRQSCGINKKEFTEFLRRNVEKYRITTGFPHYPKIEGVLYNCNELPESDGSKLEEFLNFFQLATHHDRELLKAFLLTLAWGGPPGKRPGFIFATNDDSADQGVGFGKTATITKCSSLFGGHIEFNNDETPEHFRSRLINDSGATRVVFNDNLKTLKLSSASLESWITAKELSGHQLYKGNASKPNYFVFAITANGVYLGKDLAKRYITLKIARPHYNGNWDDAIDDFIEKHRWSIIADLGRLLKSKGDSLPHEGSTRWAAWEQQVLSKCFMPLALRELLKDRMIENNDDLRASSEFFSQLMDHFEPYANSTPPGKLIHACTHDTLTEELSKFLGKRIGKNKTAKLIQIMHAPWLYSMKKPNGGLTWFFHRLGEKLTPDQITPNMIHNG